MAAFLLPPEFQLVLDVVRKKTIETVDPSKLSTSRLVAEVAFWNAAALQYDSQVAELESVAAEVKNPEEKAAINDVIALFKQLPEIGARCAAELDRRVPT